jgi:glycosyltransferase involved in cell wall biosynthesis
LKPIWIPKYRECLLELVSSDEPMLIHDHGIWLPYSGIIQRIAEKKGISLVTTIHGMLEPWALGFGRIRKQINWKLFQRSRLEANAFLHATSQEESENLRALGLNTPLALIPNGTDLPDLSSVKEVDRYQKKVIFFLSRIHPKKGLLNLVEVIDRLRPVGWIVVLAGYDEGGYWDTIQKAIEKAGLDDYFQFIGPVSDQEKWSWYKLAELFILPSFSENFGLVIAEALASETPVITTQGTPWKDLLEYNCGWWVKAEVLDMAQALQEAVSLKEEELRVMGKKGRKLVEKKYSWPAVAARIENAYQWVLEGGTKPTDILL